MQLLLVYCFVCVEWGFRTHKHFSTKNRHCLLTTFLLHSAADKNACLQMLPLELICYLMEYIATGMKP